MRDSMLSDARRMLESLDLRGKLTNERSARVLIALAGLDLEGDWSDARNPAMGIHDIIEAINRGSFDRTYAENSRETIRKDTVKPFVEAGILLKNPTGAHAHNSSKTCYQLTDDMIEFMRAWGTDGADRELIRIRARLGSAAKLSSAVRDASRETIVLPNGSTVDITGDGQGSLIRRIIEDYLSHNMREGDVVYIADAGGDVFPDTGSSRKDVADFVKAAVTRVHQETGTILKPDVVAYDEGKGLLYVIEACETGGVIDEARKRDLGAIFAGLGLDIVFVTCFESREALRPWVAEIAWGTDVWCADSVFHMIRLD